MTDAIFQTSLKKTYPNWAFLTALSTNSGEISPSAPTSTIISTCHHQCRKFHPPLFFLPRRTHVSTRHKEIGSTSFPIFTPTKLIHRFFGNFLSVETYLKIIVILYLIFNYPHKYYTFKHFEVYWNTHFTTNLPRLNEPWYDRKTTKGDSTNNRVSPDFLLYSGLLHSYFKFQDCFYHVCINFSF